MSEDDGEDWFERALREDSDSTTDESGDDGPDADSDSATDDGPDADQASADSPFEEDFAGAVENAPDIDEEPASDDSPFEEDFASAFENAPDIGDAPDGESGEDLFSGGGPSGGEQAAEPFDDDAEFDSEIERIDLGIDGLDNMILGGVPKRSLISIVGSAGTGKTTFGLQFLDEALSNGNRGVYLTLEEAASRIYDTAEEKGWPFRQYADEGRLAVVHLDPVEMANSLASIRNDLPELIEEFGADRLVLDSVSLLEMMYDRPSDRRSEVFQFSKSLKEAGVTTLVTSEASSDTPYASRYGIIEYLADAVFVLQYVRASDFQETRLAVEIQKIRDANHSRETKPYEITDEGLSVYRQANIF
ncbi:KaiC domain-containing protein [Haloplanus rubicundus]|uniref:KaiC domain-containing protein n=1 Tax=Haloplanus rubicundus TaxID=1547898 RepID=A0A345E6S3_9EURY|nr:KaiC domain-containing protein [Haloplanus rubicundus]AXG07895.1 KaiC domain-containing protein [Haloplanus rubicundus]AXG11310.1 KaiC domain-containing protein [Haloplanus rubicundus]